jgi:hypothetical protein
MMSEEPTASSAESVRFVVAFAETPRTLCCHEVNTLVEGGVEVVMTHSS